MGVRVRISFRARPAFSTEKAKHKVALNAIKAVYLPDFGYAAYLLFQQCSDIEKTREMNSFSAKLYVNKNRIKKNGCVSLYIQVIVDRKHVEVPLKIEWPFTKVDIEKGEIIPRQRKDPDHQEFSLMIETERNKFWQIAKHFRLIEKHFDLDDIIKEAGSFERRRDLVKYFDSRIKELRKTLKREDQTLRHYKVTKSRIEEFHPGVKITQVNSDWLESFAIWLKTEYKNGPNMVWTRIKDVKSFLEAACKDSIVVNPDFRKYKNKQPTTDPTYLDEDELRSLMKLIKSGTLRDDEVRDGNAFLFSCFTGLRISDLKRVNDSWIVNNELHFTPHKTRKINKTVKIPLIPLAQEYISNYKDSFQLPSDQKFNARLKKLAGKAGIKKNISAKVGRHTFATQAAISGIPVQVVSKLLGHSNLQTTMIYVHIADRIKELEMQKLQNAFCRTLTVVSA